MIIGEKESGDSKSVVNYWNDKTIICIGNYNGKLVLMRLITLA
jgi:hypothetical protein